jgi:hypothetical protein
MDKKSVVYILIAILLSNCFIFLKTAKASTDILELVKPLDKKEDGRHDENTNLLESNDISKDKEQKVNSVARTLPNFVCPTIDDYVCGNTEKNPPGEYSPFMQFPTVHPPKVEVGLKFDDEEDIDWHDVCDPNKPPFELGYNNALHIKVHSYFPVKCLTQRFTMSSCNFGSEFLAYLQAKNIIKDINSETETIDEETLWKFYVEWMSTKNPDVVRNSGRISIVLELWDLTKVPIPPGSSAPDCKLWDGDKNGLIYRGISNSRIFTITDAFEGLDIGILTGGNPIPGNILVRAKFCYIWNVFSQTLYAEKVICSKWTHCAGEPPNQPMTIDTIPTLKPARMRISRPISYGYPGDSCGDGDSTKNCMHAKSRYYHPMFEFDASDNVILKPPRTNQTDVVYYSPKLPAEKDIWYTMGTSAKNDYSSDFTADSSGSVYITTSAFYNITMNQNFCDHETHIPGIQCPNSTIVPDKMVIESPPGNTYAKYGRIRRNGMVVFFNKNNSELTILPQPYLTNGNWYPKYGKRSLRMKYKLKYPIIEGGTGALYVPVKEMSKILAVEGSYYVWEKNTRNESVNGEDIDNDGQEDASEKRMVNKDYADKCKVLALVWDSRFRTDKEIIGQTGNEISTIKDAHPSPFKTHSNYIALDAEYYVDDKQLKSSMFVDGNYSKKKANDEKCYGFCNDIKLSEHLSLTKAMFVDTGLHTCYRFLPGRDHKESNPVRLLLCTGPYGGCPTIFEKFRSIAKKDPTCGPFYRCMECNILTPSVEPYSSHIYGRSMDIDISGDIDYKIGCSLLVDAPLDKTEYVVFPRDMRKNGIGPCSYLNDDPNARRIQSYGGYFIDSYIENGSCSIRKMYNHPHYYNMPTTLPPPDNYIEPISGRVSEKPQGGLVGIETMPRPAGTWLHINCYPPPKTGWGDGDLYMDNPPCP